MARLGINGTHLECIEQGNGDPVVFVHGSASDYRTWRSQLDELGRHYRVIAYSRRYHWSNDAIPDGFDYSMEEHVDDLQALLHSIDVGTAVLGSELCRRLSDSRLEKVRASSIEAEFLGSGFPSLQYEGLRRMQVPTLPVGGGHSPGLFPRLLDRLEELLPRKERVEIRGASHIMHEDEVEACNAAVLAFLATHQTG